uniref:30S ribosomal protein S18 n=1 Tax=Dictyopteris divaricata TaxID=156996 RepID=A0A2I4Q2E8_9PHAE|nr:30S ribosomal protein S18 [Dictyopteris divaricata]YP_010205308.1 30S ribosomal protein S18 [Grateloupia livida]AQZ25020.1 30S ribosomal protein S18 [Dictyopteris divaricata]UAV85877.1 30S ribosomal protein S18 [Grateloupia livida]
MVINLENIKDKNIKPALKKRLLKNSTARPSINTFKKVGVEKKSLFNKELLKNIRKQPYILENKITPQTQEEQTKNSLIIPVVRKTQAIGYRNVKLLRSFLTEYKKIKSRRLTKLTLKQQRQLSRAVKRARMLKLFDPRKTLKPKKFLNLEKKIETTKILLMLKVLKLNKFLEVISEVKASNISETLKLLELLKLLHRKNYLAANKFDEINL